MSARGRRDWAARGALALGLAVLGYLSVAVSAANVIAKVDPARAHAIAPSDGTIMAKYAEEVFAQSPETAANSRPADLARRALLRDPTAVEALTVLGMQAQLRGEVARSDRIFALSTALSRRELRPRIWAIEKAALSGDVVGALRNYDIALRTSNEANNILFPTLAAALSEPRIRAELLKILADRPPWEKDFLEYVGFSGIEPEGAIALLREAEKIGAKPTDESRTNLVNTLVARNQYDEAWDYYRSFRLGARRDRTRDPNFALQSQGRAVFDWQPGADSRLAVAILREGQQGVIELAVPPSIGGEAVSQTQLLAPGAYILEGRSRGVEQPEGSRPFWVLSCSNGRELGRVSVTNSALNGGRHSGRFIVPQGCPVQKLSLMIRPSVDIAGVSGQILHAQLMPAR